MKHFVFEELLQIFFVIALVLSGCQSQEKSIRNQVESITPTIITDNQSSVISAENINQLRVIDHFGEGDVLGAALSADGNQIAVATFWGVTIYDARTSEPLQFINLPFFQEKRRDYRLKNAVSFSPDGRYLAIGNDDIFIWDLDKGKVTNLIENRINDYEITEINFTQNSQNLLVKSYGTKSECDALGGNFALYDTSTNSLLFNQYFCWQDSYMESFFLGTNKILLIGNPAESKSSYLDEIIVMSSTGELIRSQELDSHFISINLSGTLTSEIFSSQTNNSPTKTAINKLLSDGTTETIKSMDGKVYLLPNNQEDLLQNLGDNWQVLDKNGIMLCRFPSGKQIFFSSEWSVNEIKNNKQLYFDYVTNQIFIFDYSSCQVLPLEIPHVNGQTFLVDPTENYLLYENFSDTEIWDLKTKSIRFTIASNDINFPNNYFQFDKQGHLIAVLHDDNYKIQIWSIQDKKLIKTIQTDLSYIFNAEFNSDCTIVALETSQDLREYWDLTSGNKIAKIIGSNWNTYFTNLPQGLIYAYDSYILTTNLQEKEFSVIYTQPDGRAEINAISPDHQFFLTNNKHDVYDISGIHISTLEYQQDIVLYPDQYLYAQTINNSANTAFFVIPFISPNNQLIVEIISNNDHEFLRFFDLQTGKIIRDIMVPFEVNQIQFSQDGKTLYTLSNGQLLIWKISSDNY